MGHSQIFGLNLQGEITPLVCDTSGNLVVNSSSSLTGEALEITQLDVLSNINISKSLLTNIDTKLIDISTSTLQTITNTKLTNLDTKITQGYDSQITSGGIGLNQCLIYGRDNSGNLDALNTDTQGHLKITIQDEEKDISLDTIWNPIFIPNGSSTVSNTIDMTNYKHLLIMGNTTNTNEQLFLQYSNDDITYFNSDVYIYANYNNGDFSYTLNNTPAKYIRITKDNNSGSTETISLFSTKMKF